MQYYRLNDKLKSYWNVAPYHSVRHHKQYPYRKGNPSDGFHPYYKILFLSGNRDYLLNNQYPLG